MKLDVVAALLQQVAAKDRAAFAQLYHSTKDALFGVLMRMLRNRANAEDGLQEVYIRIWQRAASFSEGRGSGMTWMMTIARNYAIDQRRQRMLVSTDAVDVDLMIDPHPGADAQMSAESMASQIMFCIGQLERRHAECIKGAYLDGMSYADLAARHAVPINTIRTWLRRGLIKLRDCVQQ